MTPSHALCAQALLGANYPAGSCAREDPACPDIRGRISQVIAGLLRVWVSSIVLVGTQCNGRFADFVNRIKAQFSIVALRTKGVGMKYYPLSERTIVMRLSIPKTWVPLLRRRGGGTQ
jgi:hypothetical protein